MKKNIVIIFVIALILGTAAGLGISLFSDQAKANQFTDEMKKYQDLDQKFATLAQQYTASYNKQNSLRSNLHKTLEEDRPTILEIIKLIDEQKKLNLDELATAQELLKQIPNLEKQIQELSKEHQPTAKQAVQDLRSKAELEVQICQLTDQILIQEHTYFDQLSKIKVNATVPKSKDYEELNKLTEQLSDKAAQFSKSWKEFIKVANIDVN